MEVESSHRRAAPGPGVASWEEGSTHGEELWRGPEHPGSLCPPKQGLLGSGLPGSFFKCAVVLGPQGVRLGLAVMEHLLHSEWGPHLPHFSDLCEMLKYNPASNSLGLSFCLSKVSEGDIPEGPVEGLSLLHQGPHHWPAVRCPEVPLLGPCPHIGREPRDSTGP